MVLLFVVGEAKEFTETLVDGITVVAGLRRSEMGSDHSSTPSSI